MVSISLRSYINEINDMVDQRQIDESIAHCRHILETYPKHVDTYRLLGKAYLEEQRYSDASDILQRVLSSVPEDFIAQVGMSIIREDEGNLDSAIYHMERAFETQPSNHAIQSELRRLHTQRDGIEMKRVRLTRGALARMYAHGNLYEQAISELHAALAEEPNRYDLQSLLAEMYYQTDKKVDAAETCTKILEKLPHCINANRLLTIILEESGRPEEAQRYRQRWSALDPYAAFVGTEYPTVEQVPDNKISIDHFEWDPSEMYTKEGGQPGWAASLGVSISEEERSDLPDWLNGGITSPEEQMQELDDEFPTGDHRPTEMLPDEIASGESQEEDIGRIEGGRIDLMPQDTGEDEEDDWLSEFEEKSPEIEDEDEDDWLASLEEQEEETPSPSGFDPFAEPKSEQEDDWLGILDKPEAEPASEEDLFEAPISDQEEDEWLSSLGAAVDHTEAGDSDPFAEPAEVDDEEDEEVEEEPDWLSSLGPAVEQPPVEEEEEELPDFLKEAGWEPGSGEFDESAPVDYEEEDEEQSLEQADIPDWIKDMAPPDDAFEEEDLEAEADPEWLKSLETPASTEKPDWLSEMEAQPDAQPTPEAEIPPSEPLQPETPPAPASGTEIEPDEMDLAWLENLAAKRGIPDEELVTSAEQRASLTEEDRPAPEDLEDAGITAPAEQPTADSDWLQQIGQQQDAAEEEQTEAEQEPEEEIGEDTATWLSSIADDREVSPISGVGDDTISRFLAAKDVLEPDEEPARIPAEEPADNWLAELGEDDEEVELPEGGPISEEEDDIDTDWLRQIGRQAAQEAAESEQQPEEETPSPVDEEADDFDMDWLSEIGAQAAEEAAAEEAPPELLEEEEAEEEEKWLAPPTQSAPVPLDAEPEDYDDDWLTEAGEEVIEKAAAPEPPGDPESDWLHAPPTELTQADEPQITPIDEDADDIDSDWLTQIGEEALEEASEETISPGEITEEEIEEEDWLSGIASDQAEEEPFADLLPVDRADDDDLTMKWIEEVSEEAAQEAAEEESFIEPIEEIADEYDMDWLKEFAEEEAEEASPPQPVVGLPDDDELDEWLDEATQPSAAASAQAADDLDMDWLDELGAEEVKETASEPTQPSAAAPVDEEADDFDMDWLTQIGEEAAEEAAQEPEEEGLPDASQSTAIPVDAEPEDYADDWLTEAGEDVIEQAAAPEPPDEEEDWLSGPPTEPTPAPPPDLTPVDEEADDFDMDWLTQIGEEAIQEAADEDLSPGALSEEDLEEDQPAETTLPSAAAPVDEDADDFDMDWLESIGKEAAEEAAEEEQEDWLAETTQSEAAAPVDEEADDFNTAWLEEIGAEAAQEAAAGEQQPEETPEEAQPTSTDDWLTQLEEEDEGSLERAISDTDAWLLSMEDTVPTGDRPAYEGTEEPEPEIEDTGDWLASLGVEQEEAEAAEEADFEEQFELEPEPEQELPEEEAPFDREPEPGMELPAEEVLEFEPEPPAAEVQPTESEEWQLEVDEEAAAPVEPDLPPQTPPEEAVDELFETAEPQLTEETPPAPPQAETAEDQLDAARQAVSGGNIDKALASYGKLIKKGKLIDQIIKDLNDATMRHPINVKLWQTLGDAYLRLDNLQDALDAYSKAEDLIR